MSEASADNVTIFVSPKLKFGQTPVESRQAKARRNEHPLQAGLFASVAPKRGKLRKPSLSGEDNTPEGLQALLEANRYYRTVPWPEPYDRTTHTLHLGDARDLSWLPDRSVHLVVTSPPYWTLKEYAPGNERQMGHFEDYEQFLDELDRVWTECSRVLVGGGRICCVVGDVCISRKKGGRHHLVPLHADIQVRARKLGLDCLMPILWHKIANGATEAQGNGAGFYGKPYQPGAIVKNDFEYILFLRKGGSYRSPSPMQRALSVLTKREMQQWLKTSWTDIKGESTRNGHPAPYPVELAERLIRLFSFVGDTVLDPFAGTATTSIAAMNSGRNSIANELEPKYLALAKERLLMSQIQRPLNAPFDVDLIFADGRR